MQYPFQREGINFFTWLTLMHKGSFLYFVY